jgi:hypothetical protein
MDLAEALVVADVVADEKSISHGLIRSIVLAAANRRGRHATLRFRIIERDGDASTFRSSTAANSPVDRRQEKLDAVTSQANQLFNLGSTP